MASPEALLELQEQGPDLPNSHYRPRIKVAKDKLIDNYSKVPILRKLPPRAAGIIVLLIFVNLVVWAAVGIVLHYHSALAGTAILAYTFGLRHALDADHISAIDLMTRRLVAGGKRPVTVGTYFSLGHSTYVAFHFCWFAATVLSNRAYLDLVVLVLCSQSIANTLRRIVIITSIVVAATASAISSRFGSFSTIGGIIGSSVSAAFLLILGAANAYILYILIRQMKKLLRQQQSTIPHQPNDPSDPTTKQSLDWNIEGGGPLFRIFKKLFRIVDRPWKMYPIGILFGLGFDTSSEVALLGIASIQAAHGTSLWLILIFPLLFTAGMCLLDTVDGALMLALYTSASLARDTVAVLYYNVALTGLTVVVAAFIGVLQVLQLVVAVLGQDAVARSGVWRGVEVVGNRYDVIGGCICGLFVAVGVGSMLCYRPWRRWVDARHPRLETCKGDEGAFGVEATDIVGTEENAASVEEGDAFVGNDPRVSDELITVVRHG